MSTTNDLSNAELQTIARALVAFTPPTTEAQREAVAVRDKVAMLIADRSRSRSFGDMVFRMELPFEVEHVSKAGVRRKRPMAPRLNVYASMKPWMRTWLYAQIDYRIMAEIGKYPKCLLQSKPRPRGVNVVRHSSVMPDELTVDVLGGKVPVDRLVKAGILCGDSVRDLERRADWKRAPPKQGRLVIEVFELV